MKDKGNALNLSFLQVGWEKGTFVTELKNLQALGVSVFGQSLKESLDLLNINRLHTGIDHYGQVHVQLCVCHMFIM